MSIKKAVNLATQISAKAEAALASLAHEMDLMKWPPEFRKIMWEAVAHVATILARGDRP